VAWVETGLPWLSWNGAVNHLMEEHGWAASSSLEIFFFFSYFL
jgi:hypothetical protein